MGNTITIEDNRIWDIGLVIVPFAIAVLLRDVYVAAKTCFGYAFQPHIDRLIGQCRTHKEFDIIGFKFNFNARMQK